MAHPGPGARRLTEEIDRDPAVVLCDVGAVRRADLRTIDALARLTLAAAREGRHLLVRHASPDLVELLRLAGLAEVVRCAADSGVEARGQPEEGEEPRRLEEERDPADPPA